MGIRGSGGGGDGNAVRREMIERRVVGYEICMTIGVVLVIVVGIRCEAGYPSPIMLLDSF